MANTSATKPISSDFNPDGHAAAAIIVSESGNFLLQHRDDKPGIWFPGFWGLFGGAIDPGETPESALARELDEELGLHPHALEYFSQIAFDLSFAGLGVRLRYYFVAEVPDDTISGLRQREGQGMALYNATEIRAHDNLTPYDKHALLLYINRNIVSAAPEPSR